MPQPHGSDIMEHRVLLGGYSSEVPPLPIPNREVKLTNADGTAYLGGRVGSRLFKPSWMIPTRLSFCALRSGILLLLRLLLIILYIAESENLNSWLEEAFRHLYL